MKKQTSLIVIGLLLCISCSNTPTTMNDYSSALQVSQSLDSIKIGYQDYQIIGSLERIEKLENQNDTSLNNELKNWKISREDISNIISSFRLVNITEWYATCYQYSVWYKGKVSNSINSYEILISPTSYICLSNADTTLYFIEEEKTNLFLVPCDCCEYPPTSPNTCSLG